MLNIWGFVKCIFILKLLAKFSEYIIIIFILHVSQSQNHQVTKVMVTGYKQQGIGQISIKKILLKGYAILKTDLYSEFDRYM